MSSRQHCRPPPEANDAVKIVEVRIRKGRAERLPHLPAVVDHCTRNAIAPIRWPDL